MVKVYTSQSNKDGLWRFKILNGDKVVAISVGGEETERDALSIAQKVTGDERLLKFCKDNGKKIYNLERALTFLGVLAGGFAAAWAVCWLS